jgi:hypothetical protein
MLPPLLATAAVAGLGIGVWAGAANYLPDGRATDPINTVARVRALSSVSACLLTDSTGIARKPASDVWAGLQDAATDAKARATFLPLVKAGSPADEVNALVAQGCSLIVAVGTQAVGAVQSAASAAPRTVHLAGAGAHSSIRVDGFVASRAGAKALAARAFGAIQRSNS